MALVFGSSLNLYLLFVLFFMPAINNYIVHDQQLAQAQQSFLSIRSYAFWAATISLTGSVEK